jgi:hypothetical protein
LVKYFVIAGHGPAPLSRWRAGDYPDSDSNPRDVEMVSDFRKATERIYRGARNQ